MITLSGLGRRIYFIGKPVIICRMDRCAADSSVSGDHRAVIIAVNHHSRIIKKDLLHPLDNVTALIFIKSSAQLIV